ncbi:MAG: SDR family NAD(P)-dependent oxidoreductase [Gemmatimonadaceae bacterium]
MTSLAGRHALVTGANRGIGAAIAVVLSQNGATVTLLVRNRAAGEAMQSQLPGKSFVVVADITNEDTTVRACAAAVKEMGSVDILVNNAGSVESAPFSRTSHALFERMMAEHLYGPLHCIRALLPAMLAEGFGRVVNIASVAGVAGAPYVTAYCSAKHAMVGLTRSLAKEAIVKGVTVNAVCPGYTDTDLVSKGVAAITARTGRSPEDATGMLLAHNPLHRLITPEEVAASVLWLCSDGAASVTGQTIIIDGGELA